MPSAKTTISDQRDIRVIFPCAHHAITGQLVPQPAAHPITLFRTMPPRSLTPTEYRIFTHLVRGATEKDICARFRLALSTVQSHGASIRIKTGMRKNVTLAARFAPREPRLAALRDYLTPRQQQTVDLVAQGMTNQEISDTLSITPHTAKFHVQEIRKRTGLIRRADLVHLARPVTLDLGH